MIKNVGILLPVLNYTPDNVKKLISMIETYYWMQPEQNIRLLYTKFTDESFKRDIKNWCSEFEIATEEMITSKDLIRNSDTVIIWFDNSHMSVYFAKTCIELLTPYRLATEDMLREKDEMAELVV